MMVEGQCTASSTFESIVPDSYDHAFENLLKFDSTRSLVTEDACTASCRLRAIIAKIVGRSKEGVALQTVILDRLRAPPR
jgi:hypothetical protein